MEYFIEFILKLGKVDRRWIFLIIGIAVLIPILKPLGMPIRPSDSSQKVYSFINDSLANNSKVLLSLEYSPSTKPENHPMTISIMRHLFSKGHKIYITCLWPDGEFMAQDAIKEIAIDELSKDSLVYGLDYVLLGYRPGAEAVVKGIVSNIRQLYTVDARQIKVEDIPMMDGVNKFEDFDFLFSISSGTPGTTEWVQYAADPTGVPMSSGVTSIQVNEMMPYVQSGQMIGILAGMPGAAEYEKLTDHPGTATSGMDAQSIAHLVIVLFIVLGNVSYFIERSRSKKY